MLQLDLSKRPDFVELKTLLPDWFNIYAPKIGKLGTMSNVLPRHRESNTPLLIIDGTSTPKLEGNQSSKKEIMEFFNMNVTKGTLEGLNFAEKSTYVPEDYNRGSLDTKVSQTSVLRTVHKDVRLNDSQDMFEANGIDKYCYTETEGYLKAIVNEKLEQSPNGAPVLRSYVTYGPISDPKELDKAKKYIASTKEHRVKGQPVEGLSRDIRLSDIELTYSVDDLGVNNSTVGR